MKVYTHGDPIPPGSQSKAARLAEGLLKFMYLFMGAFILFVVVVMCLYIHSIAPALVVLVPVGILAAGLAEQMWDFKHAYVELNGTELQQVDYLFWCPRKRQVSMTEIVQAEVYHSGSSRIPGRQWGMQLGGLQSYIVFYDARGKARFRLVYTPERAAFFRQFVPVP